MAVSLVIFILLVLFFALRGFRQGFFGALSGILGLIGGYAAAIYCSKPLAALLQQHTGLDGLLVYILASFLAFVTASLVISFIFTQLERLLMSGRGLSALSRFGGLLVGLTVGGTIGILVVYAVSVYRDLKQPPLHETPAGDLSHHSLLDTTSRQVVSRATATALSRAYPEATKITTAIAEDPVKMGRSVNNVLKNDELKLLLSDAEYQALLTRGNIEQLQQSPAFRQLVANPDMQYLLEQSDIAQAGESKEQAFAVTLTSLAQRMDATRNDARVQAIINDPEFQRKLQADDKFALLRDPQVVQLAELIFGDENIPAPAGSTAVAPAGSSAVTPEAATKAPGKIYRHVDKNGKIHFSDKPFDDPL